jgi:putative peptidoglycan lipid II flippase
MQTRTAVILRSFIANVRKSRKIKDMLRITIYGTIGKVGGLIIPLLIATWFGVSSETDAFLFVYGIAIFITTIFTPSLEKIPVSYIVENLNDREFIGIFVGRLLVVFGLVVTTLIGFAIYFSSAMLSMVTAFDPLAIQFIHELIISLSPFALLAIWSSIIVSALIAHKKFTSPALSTAPRAAIILLSMYLFRDELGVYSIIVGYILGELFRLSFLVLSSLRARLPTILFKGRLGNRAEGLTRVFSYQLVASIVFGLAMLVDRSMASWLGAGSVSIMHYAERLYFVPYTFLVGGMIPVLLAHWGSEHHDNGDDISMLATSVNFYLAAILTVGAIISLTILNLSGPSIAFIFSIGDYPQDKIPTLLTTFGYYILGLGPQIGVQILILPLIILKRTGIILSLSIITLLIRIGFNYYLMQFYGIAGIALSTTLSNIIFLLILWIVFTQLARKSAMIQEGSPDDLGPDS